MEIPLRKRLSYRQARLTVLAAVGLGFIFSSIGFFLDLRREIHRLEANIQQTMDVVAPGAAAATQATDRAAARRITSALLRYPPFYIYEAEILDDYGVRIASTKRPQARSRLDWLVDGTFGPSRTFRYPLFPYEGEATIHRVVKNGKDELVSTALPASLGNLVVSLDHHVVMNQFVGRWLLQLSTEIFRLALLAGLLMWAFHRLITRPLGMMAWHYSSIDLDQPGDCRFMIPKAHREDELGLLAESVNHAMERLSRNAESQKQSNFHLQREMDERRKAEAALTRKEGQLENARRMEAAGHLAVGVAQEFNHLLTGIQGYAQMIRDAKPAEQSGLDASEILTSCARAQELTTRLLALGSRQSLRPVALNLNELLAEMEASLRSATPGIQIKLEKASNLWNLLADHVMLEKAVQNLVISAAESMDGHGTIILRTENAEIPAGKGALPPGQWVCLSVEDDGPIIPKEALSRVFEPFSPVRGTNKKRDGLRLATALGIARQTGGHLTVSSHPARGTCFDLLLPMTPNAVVRESAKQSHATGMSHSETVLVIETDAALRSLLTRMLVGLGYRVLSAEKEDQALDAARNCGTRIDLLLSELDLPTGSGSDLHRQLREAGIDCAALFTAGAGGETSSRSATGIRPEFLLIKPFTQAVLALKIRDILDGQTATQTQP